MENSEHILKRKTMRLNHPNPLFEKWLKEWRDEAAARNSDTQYAFAKALQSLKKYPLPLKSGQECLVLENFGTRISLLLDRKLADYKKSCPEDQGSGIVHSLVEENDHQENDIEKKKKPKKHNTQLDTHSNKNKKLYIPTLRSSSYAVLVALCQHLKKRGPPGEMSKEELQKAAQPLCDTSMFKPLPGSHYSGWSCVGQLVKKQLVQRSGKPHRYSLTEEGLSLAEKLPLFDIDLSDSHPSSSPVSPEKMNHQKISKVTKKTTVSVLSNENISEKETEPGTSQLLVHPPKDMNNFNRDYLSQDSTSTQSSQCEEEIFLPGSFQIILLVDTQEIHKGDELVKALEAQGTTPEVRRLKVGDFAWIGRNEKGQELLLPYIVERKRLDDLASSIKDGRFHEQKFRMKKCGVPNYIYLVEKHGQRQYSLPTSTLLQAAANTQFIDGFTLKQTANSHETVVYLTILTKVIKRRFSNKTLIGCQREMLPKFEIDDDCISVMSFKEFNKLGSKTRKYCVKEMFIKQLVQLRGLSVEKAMAIVERYPCPQSLMAAFQGKGDDKLLTDIPAGSLGRKIGPAISKTVYELYNKSVLS